MQSVSQTFENIISQGGYKVETKLLINGTEFKALSISVHNTLFAGGSQMVGGCVSGEIDAEIVALSANIPRMAKLEPYIRLVKDRQESEWIRKGVYYIDTRSEDTATGILSVHGYDAMLKCEQMFTATDIRLWNKKKDIEVVSLIAERIGVTVDERTVLGRNYEIPAPDTDDSAESLRETLGHIGAAYGGNWVITFDNKLLLCKLGDIPTETYYLVDRVGTPILFGGDRIVI